MTSRLTCPTTQASRLLRAAASWRSWAAVGGRPGDAGERPQRRHGQRPAATRTTGDHGETATAWPAAAWLLRRTGVGGAADLSGPSGGLLGWPPSSCGWLEASGTEPGVGSSRTGDIRRWPGGGLGGGGRARAWVRAWPALRRGTAFGLDGATSRDASLGRAACLRPVDLLGGRGRDVAVAAWGGRATRRHVVPCSWSCFGPFGLDGGLHALPQLLRQRRQGRRSRHGRSGPVRASHTLRQFTAVLFICHAVPDPLGGAQIGRCEPHGIAEHRIGGYSSGTTNCCTKSAYSVRNRAWLALRRRTAPWYLLPRNFRNTPPVRESRGYRLICGVDTRTEALR